MRPSILPTRTALFAAVVISLAGCASPIKQSVQQADAANSEATAAVRQLQSGYPGGRPTFESHDGQWVDPTPVEVKTDDTLPQLQCIERFHPSEPKSIDEFAQIVGQDCNVVIHVTADAHRHLMGGGSASSAAGGGPIAPAQIGGGATLPGIPAASISSQYAGGGQMVTDNMDARLSDELDQVTGEMGLGWKVSDGEITIFYLDSKTFRFSMIPTSTSMSTSVVSGTTTQAGISSGGGGSGSGGGGGSGGVSGSSGTNQQTDITMKDDPRADFEKTIGSMLSPEGKMGPMTATGTVTVTDTPDVLQAIQSYVDAQNHILTKQVLFNVRVVSVTLNKTDNYGINWNLVFKTLSGNYGFNLTNSFAAASNSVSGSINILPTATGSAAKFAGTSAVLQALSEQGKVATITSPSATTLNMQPVIVQVAKQTGFLASSQTSNVAQVGSSTALVPGMITSGFNMNLVPDVLADGKTILLQYNMNLSSDPVLRTVESGGSTIEIPQLDTKILSHKVQLQSGETLVLSGFEQNSNNNDKSGIGSPGFWALGGGVSRKDSRVVLVVMITPIVTS